MKDRKNMHLRKFLIAILFITFLTASVLAQTNTDATESSEIIKATKLSPSDSTNAETDESERIFTNQDNSDDNTIEYETIPASKISITLNPRKQTSGNGLATYEITIKAHYLPNTDSLEVTKYKLEFNPEDRSTTGSLGLDHFTLQPGEKITTELKVRSENPGEHRFLIRVTDEEGQITETEGLLSVVDSTSEPSLRVKLDLEPEKQYTRSGTATYEVLIHRPLETPCYSNTDCANIFPAQEYELLFISEQEALTGKFTQPGSVSLKPGEKKLINLEVMTEKEATYVFKVHAKTQGYETSTRGLLVYGEEPQTTSVESYLEGEGFAINEDQSEGKIIYLNLLGDKKDLRGKIAFGSDTYALKGAISKDETEVYLGLYDLEDGGLSQSIGEFHGEIHQFDNFALLKGSIDFETRSYPNQYWTLNIMGKRSSVFENEIIVAEPNTPVTKTINKEEVVTIRQGHNLENTDSEESRIQEAYIVPEKIERKKILGIIPNPWGDKVLKVKIFDGEDVIETEVTEFGSKNIGNYEVSVGSLEDEDAIEVSVKKSS